MKFIDGIDPISVARNYVPTSSRWLKFEDDWNLFFELEHSDVFNIVELARKYEKDLDKPRSTADLRRFEWHYENYKTCGLKPNDFWRMRCDLFSITRVLQTRGYCYYEHYKANGSVNGSYNPYDHKQPHFFTEAQKKKWDKVEEKIRIRNEESDKALSSFYKCRGLFDTIFYPILKVNIEDRELKQQLLQLEKAKQKLEEVNMVIASKANPSDIDSWFLPELEQHRKMLENLYGKS